MKNAALILILFVIAIAVILVLAFSPGQSDETITRDEPATTETTQPSETDSETAAETSEPDDETVQEDTDSETSLSGGYEEYSPEKLAFAEDGTVIIFFHATWCPTCRALSANIESNMSDIPEDVLILKADYDSETQLKAKYGVTIQHTLVQVDADGNMITKWTGSSTLDRVLGEIK